MRCLVQGKQLLLSVPRNRSQYFERLTLMRRRIIGLAHYNGFFCYKILLLYVKVDVVYIL